MFSSKYIVFIIVTLHTTNALGRHKMMAKQHETPLFFVDDFRDRNLFVGEEPFLQDALNEEIQREINEELEKIPLPPGPNRLPPRQVTNSGSFTSEKSSSNSLTEKRFKLQEVEIWIVLSALLGAVLALIGLSLCKLCRVRCFAKKQSDICHIESQKVFDSVIQDGLDTVSKTKKVVVMNIHMVPCNHHPSPKTSQIRVNKLPQTELTPNGAIIAQAKRCQQNLTSTKHSPHYANHLHAHNNNESYKI